MVPVGSGSVKTRKALEGYLSALAGCGCGCAETGAQALGDCVVVDVGVDVDMGLAGGGCSAW
jgi:hypothetical protein